MSESVSDPRILIVDESRMVRAMLAKQIRGTYAFREEANGELAWQALVIDPSIQMVVCSLSMPLLNGDELLARMRASALSRLARMPMLLIAGDNADAVERAKAHGATDFIDRQSLADDLLSRIDTVLKSFAMPEKAETVEVVKEEDEVKEAEDVMHTEAGAAGSNLLSEEPLTALVAQEMTQARENGEQVNVLVMEFDDVADLRKRYGDDTVRQLQERFVAIIGSRVRAEDRLGYHVDDQLAIISPGITREACQAFSDRLRKAIKKAKISSHGDRLNLSVSAGIANFPQDGVDSADALLELASDRLWAAQQAGGDCVVAAEAASDDQLENQPENQAQELTIEQALALLETGGKSRVTPYLPTLGYRLLPLLKLLDRELKLGLSLGGAEIKLRKMWHSARDGHALSAPDVASEQDEHA